MKDQFTYSDTDIIMTIQSVIKELGISNYLITKKQKESVELYFIKKALDMRRKSDVTDIEITVYRDFEEDGKKMRGSSSTSLYISMSKEEIKAAISDAYYAASFVKNPYYDIPSGVSKDLITLPSKLMEHSAEENAMLFASALYEPDTSSQVFINSSEFFSTKSTVRIVNSNGIDVSYTKASLSGEFIAQCKTPNDVETYQKFQYDDLELEEMKTLSSSILETTKYRAQATNAPKTGTYNIILSDEQVRSLFTYYTNHSSAHFIYAGYSNYKIDESIQGESVENELLNIQLCSNVPYSSEGIELKNRPLITDGKLKTIHGKSQYAYYLGIEATGTYNSIKVDNGTLPMEDMKKKPYLHVVNFSDFQIDPITGNFGGEIRLAFYYDGNTVTPVTGGSITSNIANHQNQLIFSTDRQITSNFNGPKAIYLKNIQVSGQ